MKNSFISSVWDFQDTGSTQTGYLTHDILRWYGKLIPQLVVRLLDLYSEKNDTVLANFSGSGTVALEAHLAGRNAIGIDANSLSLLLSRVKANPSKFEVDETIALIHRNSKNYKNTDWDSDSFLQKWFDKENYEMLKKYVYGANKIQDVQLRDTLLLAIASIVKKCSRIDSRCVNHIIVDNNKIKNNVQDEFRKKLQSISRDSANLHKVKSKNTVKIIEGDARQLPLKDNSIDFIISHPPYLGAIDYTNIMQLENLILGNDNKIIDASDISTTSMKNYLSSMQNVFSEMHRVVKPGKHIAVIIGDNRKNGNIQPTFAYFIQDATDRLGLELKDIFIWITKSKAGMSVSRRGNYIDHNYILIFKKSVE